MYKPSIFFSITLLASLLTGCAANAAAQANEAAATGISDKEGPTATSEVISRNPPASCPLTIPQEPVFVPPVPYDLLGFEGYFWFGSSSLWTSIPEDSVWFGLPKNPEGYTQKIFWWRDGYVWNEEPEPDLVVTGERLDADAPLLAASKATNAYASDIGSAMLVGMDFPAPGCWKITGKYQDAELSFVVWVGP